MAVYCHTVALGARQPPDAEAIELDELAGMVDLQVPLRRRLGPLRLGWGGTPADQAIAPGPGAQVVAAQHPPDPVGRQLDGAPARLGELGGDREHS